MPQTLKVTTLPNMGEARTRARTGGLTRVPELAEFHSFSDAAAAVLAFLQQRHPMGLWMVTRTVQEDWVVLRTVDSKYDVHDGDVFRWSDSFCSRMVAGEGPNVAPDSTLVPAYVEAPIGQDLPISSYVGFPLQWEDQFFGTLCAIDPQPQSAELSADQDLFALLSRLLSTIIGEEMRAVQLSAAAERLSQSVHYDALTGLLNRAGWDRLITQATSNAAQLGDPQSVVMIDLDGLKAINDSAGHLAGDEYLRKAAAVLTATVRVPDIVARLGGDEFGILLDNTLLSNSSALLPRLRKALEAAGVRASMGWAARDPRGPLVDAIAEADRQMYLDKVRRREIYRGAGNR